MAWREKKSINRQLTLHHGNKAFCLFRNFSFPTEPHDLLVMHHTAHHCQRIREDLSASSHQSGLTPVTRRQVEDFVFEGGHALGNITFCRNAIKTI
jgi:hypothetical protein